MPRTSGTTDSTLAVVPSRRCSAPIFHDYRKDTIIDHNAKTDGDCARSPHIGRSVASRTLPQPSALNTYSTATRRVDWR